MKNVKGRLLYAVPALIIVLAALTLTLFDTLIPLRIFKFPSANISFLFSFIIVNFVGFGIMCVILGFVKKSSWYFFLSSGLLAVSVFFIFAQFLAWWIALIIALVIAIVIALLSYMTGSNVTEDIALNDKPEPKKDKPEYKNYKERKAEKEAEEAKKEPEEIPEIKSFK